MNLNINSKFEVQFLQEIEKIKIPLYGCDSCDDSFSVQQPSMINNKFVAYQVCGSDKLGNFEGRRRYNEFYVLRSILATRWVGLFVPALPPKKAMGNKDVKFIVERRYFLERFVKQLSRSPFMVNSEEFKIFARSEMTGGNPDVEKQVQKLPKLTGTDMLQRFVEAFMIDDFEFFQEKFFEKQDEWEQRIKDFDIFLRKIINQYTLLRQQLKGLI